MRLTAPLLVLFALPLATADPTLVVRDPVDVACGALGCPSCVRVWTNPPGATWSCAEEECGASGAAACMACVRVWTHPPGLSAGCLP